MRIYFSAAISAGRKYAPIYQHIVAELKTLGHTVLTEFVADVNFRDNETELNAAEVYARDEALLHDCDLVVAEISHPSTGVGYEIAYALQKGKRVLAIYLCGLNVSKMITGNRHENLAIHSYESVNELLDGLPTWVESSARSSLAVQHA